MSTRAERIEAILREHLSPQSVEVVDDSAKHAGHAGAAPGGETHFSIRVVAPAFEGRSRIDRSRAVHTLLATEFASGLHAIALNLRTPAEVWRIRDN